MNYSTTNIISKHFLTVVHIVMHNDGNNDDKQRSLKYYIQNFNTFLKIWKYKIKILFILKKTNLKVLLLKTFVFMEGFYLPHRQMLLGEDRTFHYKGPFPLSFISLKKIQQWARSRKGMFNVFSLPFWTLKDK